MKSGMADIAQGAAVYHASMAISWSPDNAHVIVLDQAPRAPMFFAAELRNGKWVNVSMHIYELGDHRAIDPKMPKLTRVTKVKLLDWLSPVMLQVKVSNGSLIPAGTTRDNQPIVKEANVNYVTTLQFRGDKVYFAAQ